MLFSLSFLTSDAGVDAPPRGKLMECGYSSYYYRPIPSHPSLRCCTYSLRPGHGPPSSPVLRGRMDSVSRLF